MSVYRGRPEVVFEGQKMARLTHFGSGVSDPRAPIAAVAPDCATTGATANAMPLLPPSLEGNLIFHIHVHRGDLGYLILKRARSEKRKF
jgi:hypothetical protein